jgi:hypothetical protein
MDGNGLGATMQVAMSSGSLYTNQLAKRIRSVHSITRDPCVLCSSPSTASDKSQWDIALQPNAKGARLQFWQRSVLCSNFARARSRTAWEVVAGLVVADCAYRYMPASAMAQWKPRNCSSFLPVCVIIALAPTAPHAAASNSVVENARILHCTAYITSLLPGNGAKKGVC